MSVVAGCRVLDGVLIAADTRITYRKPDGSFVYVDNGLKIFPFAPGTAIGYVGRVETASILLQHLISGRDRRKHTDPSTLLHWIPRLLRAVHSRFNTSLRADVTFLVASSFRGRLSLVDRTTVFQIASDAITKGLGMWNAVIPSQMLASQVPIACSSSVLYALRSPDFLPQFCPQLHYMAIGSGHGATTDISRAHGMILFGTYDQEWWFRDAVSGFAERTDLDSVGGLYPVIKVCGNDFLTLPQSVKTYKRGSSEIEADVTLDCERNVWWQRNHLTGKSIKLELPWSILPDARTNILFDDIDKRRR